MCIKRQRQPDSKKGGPRTLQCNAIGAADSRRRFCQESVAAKLWIDQVLYGDLMRLWLSLKLALVTAPVVMMFGGGVLALTADRTSDVLIECQPIPSATLCVANVLLAPNNIEQVSLNIRPTPSPSRRTTMAR